MPGGVWTGLQQHWDPATLEATKAQVPATDASGMGVKTPEQGAATSVLLATWPGLRGVGGRYFEDCHEAEVVDADPRRPARRRARTPSTPWPPSASGTCRPRWWHDAH